MARPILHKERIRLWSPRANRPKEAVSEPTVITSYSIHYTKLYELDGYGLLHGIKSIPETSFIPVILISGRLRSEEEELKAFDKGFFDVIIKPLT